MREKLQLLMNSENLTGSKLAEYLGIQPSSISHILGGRNKPSLDFVQKILQRYPRINPDWLLLDSEDMYRPNAAPVAAPEINAQLPFEGNDATPDTFAPADSSTITSATPQSASTTMANNEANLMMGAMTATNRGNIKRVIVLFDDHTFESYDLKR